MVANGSHTEDSVGNCHQHIVVLPPSFLGLLFTWPLIAGTHTRAICAERHALIGTPVFIIVPSQLISS